MLVRARYVASSKSCAHSSQAMARFVRRHICGDSIQPTHRHENNAESADAESATAHKAKMPKIRLVRSSRGHIGASAQYLDFPSISQQPTLLPEQLPVIADAVCLSVLSALGDAFAARLTGSNSIPRPLPFPERLFPQQRTHLATTRRAARANMAMSWLVLVFSS